MDTIESSGRSLTTVTCSECKKETQVPFTPSADRPVYCNECFAKKRATGGPRGGGFGGGGRGGGRGFRDLPRKKVTFSRSDYPGYKAN